MRAVGMLVFATIGIVAASASAQTAKRAMKPVPIGSPAEWFGPENYPPEAAAAGRQGRTVVAIGVDGAGKVVSCEVRISSGTTSLDTGTCAIAMAKGLYNPATDRRGKPIASVVHLAVRWTLPDDAAMELTSDTLGTHVVETEMLIGVDGLVVSCRETTTPAPAAKESASDGCKARPPGTRISPGQSKDGKPVRIRMVRRVAYTVTIEP